MSRLGAPDKLPGRRGQSPSNRALTDLKNVSATVTISDEEAAILDHELRALSPGGAAGGALIAQFFKPNIAERELSLEMPLKESAELARDTLAQNGKVIKSGLARDGSHVVQGVVGAGKGNMNPAAVTITLTTSGDTTHLHVRGVAREGLIKQRAGQQAVERIASHLDQRR